MSLMTRWPSFHPVGTQNPGASRHISPAANRLSADTQISNLGRAWGSTYPAKEIEWVKHPVEMRKPRDVPIDHRLGIRHDPWRQELLWPNALCEMQNQGGDVRL